MERESVSKMAELSSAASPAAVLISRRINRDGGERAPAEWQNSRRVASAIQLHVLWIIPTAGAINSDGERAE